MSVGRFMELAHKAKHNAGLARWNILIGLLSIGFLFYLQVGAYSAALNL